MSGYEFEDQPKARATDPRTSHEAAETALTTRAGSQRHKLWQAFKWSLDLTDEEAAVKAGISLTSEYATRCSELRNAGYIRDTGAERVGASGSRRIVSQITDLGHQEYDRLFKPKELA